MTLDDIWKDIVGEEIAAARPDHSLKFLENRTADILNLFPRSGAGSCRDNDVKGQPPTAR
jgi:hypothetical protein